MRHAPLLVVTLAGCGRISFGQAAGDAGGVADAVDASDSGSSAQRCNWINAYGDDFESASIDPKWSVTTGPGTQIQQAGGRLSFVLAPSMTAAAYAVLAATTAQDMRGRCVFVTLVTAPTQTATTDTFLGVGPFGGGDHAGFNLHGGRLEIYTRISTTYTIVTDVAFDPAAHAIWQLREEGGEMLWETSPTGTLVFTEQHRGVLPFSLQSIGMTLQAGTYGSVTSPGQAVFDNLNLP